MTDIKRVGMRPLAGAGGRPLASSAGRDFRLPDTADPAPSAAATLPAGAADLNAVLVPDGTEERRQRNRRAQRRGDDLLGVLVQYQRALLADAESGAAIDALCSLLTDLPEAADPELAAMLRAIALRARIVLALHG